MNAITIPTLQRLVYRLVTHGRVHGDEVARAFPAYRRDIESDFGRYATKGRDTEMWYPEMGLKTALRNDVTLRWVARFVLAHRNYDPFGHYQPLTVGEVVDFMGVLTEPQTPQAILQRLFDLRLAHTSRRDPDPTNPNTYNPDTPLHPLRP